MLWISRFDANPALDVEGDHGEVLAKLHYPIMRSIAETMFSPVGLLDLNSKAVLAFDKDTMTAPLEGKKRECTFADEQSNLTSLTTT